MQQAKIQGKILTGLLYVDPKSHDLHQILDTVAQPLNTLREKDLSPGAAALERINEGFR
jgi:2-oxoglutarate ferredoxin oxidoreductase subunit beta